MGKYLSTGEVEELDLCVGDVCASLCVHVKAYVFEDEVSGVFGEMGVQHLDVGEVVFH